MPTAQEILQQLKIDDFEALKNKLSIAINNINYIPFRVKIKKELDSINLTTHIGKLDLAVLACVLNQMQLFEEKIQMHNPALDANDYLTRVISHHTFTSIFDDDIDVIDEADTQLTDDTISREMTPIEQLLVYAKILAIQAKAEANAGLEAVAAEPHCAAAFTLISEKKEQASLALQGAASWVSKQASKVTDDLNEAAFRKVRSFFFRPAHPANVQRNLTNARESDWQPPLPGRASTANG